MEREQNLRAKINQLEAQLDAQGTRDNLVMSFSNTDTENFHTEC